MDVPIDDVIQDIYTFMLEENPSLDYEAIEADLLEIAENPININTATESDLQRLLFLSPEQIDDILLYVYQQPMQSLYELQLISSLKRYEIRDLLPFIVAEPVQKEQPIYWREIGKFGKHEVLCRLDARNIQENKPDVFYTSLKYQFNYANRLQAGITMEHDVGEQWWTNGVYGFDFYSGFFQMQNFGCLQRLVVGDFRASFGQGLVLNTNRIYGGKSNLMSQLSVGNEGITRFASTSEYDFFRGVGAMFNCTHGFSLSAFYSARKVDSRPKGGVIPSIHKTGNHVTQTEINGKRATWQQVAGVNLTWKYRQLKLGFTATEHILSDTLRPTPNYYNTCYFQGDKQASLGVNYYYHNQDWTIYGEVATAQNAQWGWANITGLRYAPFNDVAFTTQYRYYSPYFDNQLGNAFAENSRNNDENGLYIGTEVSTLARWRFAAYFDAWYFSLPKYGIRQPGMGYDAFLLTDFYVNEHLTMNWKARYKYKGMINKPSLRYTLSWSNTQWGTTTIVEANFSMKSEEKGTYGAAIGQDVEYNFSQIPITLQARVVGYYTPDYDNRIYFYENDVLYANSAPMLYGKGVKCYLNVRYHINDMVALYLKASHVFAAEPRTDIHFLLRLKL